MDLNLRPEQQQVLHDVQAAFRAGHKRVMVSAACGFGKCHGKGTRVVMADGTTRAVEDVGIGDRLASPTGSPCTVLSLGRGREEMYRVEPIKGVAYTVNRSHLLSLKVSAEKRLTLADGRRVTLGELVAVDMDTFLRSNKTAQKSLKGWRPSLVQFEQNDLHDQFLGVPPYILGAWLGDGRATGAELTKPPCRLVDAWTEWGRALGCEVRIDTSNGTRCQTFRLVTRRGALNPALHALWAAGVLGNKHIPLRYLTAPVADRLELLAGMLDSDGHQAVGGYDWICKDEAMAREFAFLARSLGFASYLTTERKGIRTTGFSAMYWRCSVSGDTARIPCRDKVADERRINKDHLVTGIRNVVAMGEGDYYGFELDGDHLYLLEDFTVCHNTEIAAAMLRATHVNGKRGAFIADRVALCTQSSERFDRYGLPHGVLQGDHWRFRPSEPIQVCSVQTLRRRRWPETNLIVVDEAHVLHGAIKTKLEARDCYAIGLSATAVTPGLGKYFDVVVNAPSTNRLIERGLLVPLKIFCCAEPDMVGVKVGGNGEWDGKETDKRVLQVVGDVVKEYQAHGGGKKFIGFASSIAHAEELRRQFLAVGINVATYTADDEPEDRSEVVQEFKKADSKIRGIFSVEALTRGFDVADVEVLILARPLRKALAVLVQMMGRVMRTAEGKTHALVLDHSGNCWRFRQGWMDLFENGVTELDDGKRREKKPAEKLEREPIRCSACRHMHLPAPVCPACGHEYPKRVVEHVAGTLREMLLNADPKQLLRDVWPQVCMYARERKGDEGGRLARATYKDLTGKWPSASFEGTVPQPVSREVLGKIKSLKIAYHARLAKERQEAAAQAPVTT